MTVDSKELYARYKELKAQGQSVSLVELKAQMEREQGGSQVQTPAVSGFKALSSPSEYSTPNMTNSLEVNSYSSQLGGYDMGSNSSSILQQPEYVPTPSSSLVRGVEEQQTSQDEPKIKKFALIGCPLGHSLSTYVHEAGFKSIGLDATYEIIETPAEKLVDTVKYLKGNGYSGFNVTIPHKLPVTLFLDNIDSSANIVNAVNTVKIDEQTHKLTGYNTDAIGFLNAIPNDIPLIGKTIGVLGTGGAARAAIAALAQNKVKTINLYTRSIPNCLKFLNYLRETFKDVEFNSYQIEYIRDLSKTDILVNTTPIGMQGYAGGMTPVEEEQLRTLPTGAVVYDVIYNPKKTQLIKLAEKLNYRTINGVDMFVRQAMEAEKIWTGRIPDFKDMKIAVLENL